MIKFHHEKEKQIKLINKKKNYKIKLIFKTIIFHHKKEKQIKLKSYEIISN